MVERCWRVTYEILNKGPMDEDFEKVILSGEGLFYQNYHASSIVDAVNKFEEDIILANKIREIIERGCIKKEIVRVELEKLLPCNFGSIPSKSCSQSSQMSGSQSDTPKGINAVRIVR